MVNRKRLISAFETLRAEIEELYQAYVDRGRQLREERDTVVIVGVATPEEQVALAALRRRKSDGQVHQGAPIDSAAMASHQQGAETSEEVDKGPTPAPKGRPE